MDDVGASQLASEQRPVPQLGDYRSNELDGQQPVERLRWQRIDRYKPRLDVRVIPPAIEHPFGLDGLPSENPERGGNDGNAQTAGLGAAHISARRLRARRVCGVFATTSVIRTTVL